MRSLLPLVLVACATQTPPAPPKAAVNLDDPASCGECHWAVVRDWTRSMHASAHQDADPVYAGMRTLRMGREGEALGAKCNGCHTPRDPQSGDSPAARAGVSCATCHHLAAVDGEKMGAAALTRAEGTVLRGPHDVTDAAGRSPHGVGPAAPWLTDGRTICLACHGAMKNPQGVATCSTGPENAEGGGAPCTSCHMPEVEEASGAVSSRKTHRSHAFHGPHDLWRDDATFMSTAVGLSGTLAEGQLTATLVNQAGHAVPSAFPGRMVLVKATGRDATGATVWTNAAGDPMAEDPQSVLNKVYVDADGKPTMPPYGVELKRDSRLAPAETRTLTWAVPEGVVSAEVQLVYRLVPPPAVGPLGLEGKPEAEARVIESLTVP